jgi:hypothetical protein
MLLILLLDVVYIHDNELAQIVYTHILGFCARNCTLISNIHAHILGETK